MLKNEVQNEHVMSEYDEGFVAGVALAREEAARVMQASIDRLEPGKQTAVREALCHAEAVLRHCLGRLAMAARS